MGGNNLEGTAAIVAVLFVFGAVSVAVLIPFAVLVGRAARWYSGMESTDDADNPNELLSDCTSTSLDDDEQVSSVQSVRWVLLPYWAEGVLTNKKQIKDHVSQV